MSTKLEQVEEQFQVKQYKIQYPISAYTFPRETRIHQVRIDDKYLHLELTDGRMLLDFGQRRIARHKASCHKHSDN